MDALHGRTEASYYYWRKQLMPAPGRTAQLIARPFTSGHGEPMLEVETPDGSVIRPRSLAQLDWLGAVAQALAH